MVIKKSKIEGRIFYNLLLVAIFPLLIILFYTSTAYYNNLKEGAIERELVMQHQSVDNLSLFLQKAEFITMECYDPNVQNILKSENDNLIDFISNQNTLMTQFNTKMDLFNIVDKMDSITLLSKNDDLYTLRRGEGTFASSEALPTVESIKALPLDTIAKSYRHESLFLGEDGEINFLRTINDPNNNKYIGLILLQFSSDRLSESFPSYSSGDTNNHILILNEERDLLYSDLQPSFSATQKFKKLGDNSSVYLSNTINLEKQGVVVRLLANQNDLLAPVDKLRFITLIIIALSYIAVIIISRLVSQSLVRPISKIKKGIDKISEGDYSYKLNISSDDELGEMAHAFENMSSKIDRLINEVYATELSEKEATIASLTAQINPHFLYNTLDMVKSMAEIDGNEDISDIVKALSVLFRYSTKSDNFIVSVREELDNLSNYIKIIDARFGGKIKFNIICDEEIKDYQIIKLSLQPLVENSIQHGLLKKNNNGNIVIMITSDGEYLNIVEIDNGSGIEVDDFEKLQKDLFEGKTIKSNKYGGVGIRNINERIKLYYGEEYGIKLNNYPGDGLRVEIKIPLDNKNKGRIK